MSAHVATDMFPAEPGDPSRAGIEAPEDKWPQILAEIVDVLRAVSRKRGRSDAEAIADAEAGALAIGKHIGGATIYLPRGDRLREFLRDRRIWQEFTGGNTLELARRHGLTERHVQRILAEQRVIHVRRIQPQLFDSDQTPPPAR